MPFAFQHGNYETEIQQPNSFFGHCYYSYLTLKMASYWKCGHIYLWARPYFVKNISAVVWTFGFVLGLRLGTLAK